MKLGARRASLILVLLLSATAAAGEPDWFTRVKRDGIDAACEVHVARHRSGVEKDSLHIGRCYFLLGRYQEGVAVYSRLTRSPDRNYAAAALARTGEGYFHLGQPETARRAFLRCIEEHPEAWLDGSVPEFCRAWIRKLDGDLRPAEGSAAAPKVSVSEVRREVEALEMRLAELRRLMQRLSAGE
jgi:tetratricopeptide (TPR) repeat protein